MVDKDNMSVEEMIAYCRQTDGEGGGAPADTPAPSAGEPESTPAETSAPAAAAKPPGEMSIEEMMAAARGEKSEGAAPAAAPKAEKPASKPASATPPGEMSIEEMMAAARGEKSGGAGAANADEAEEEAAPAASGGGDLDPKAAREMSMEEMLAAARGGGGGAKPAAKPATKAKAKPAKKAAPADKGKPAKPAHTGPKDTGSILGERSPAKPGPVSKAEAEAAAKGQDQKKAKPEKVMPAMPERPAYVSPAPAEPAEGSDRRGFFAAATGMVMGSSMAIGFASLAVTNLLWTLGLAKFMFPNILIEPPTKFKVGFPSEYAPGQVQTKYKAQFGVWVVRYEYEGEPQIYAIKSVCTHLGCTPNWLEGEQKFKCPCHGSGFYKDGINFEGPAPRPLERYAIRIADDGQLEVDKSQTFNEEKGQWADGASFVTV